MIYIFLDANFILVPAQLKIDIYSELQKLVPSHYKLIVLSAIFKELEDKVSKRPAKGQFHKIYDLSRQILDQKEYFVLEKNRKNERQLVDDLLLEVALDCSFRGNKVYIATNDKLLRTKCKNKGIQTIFIRQRKRLDVE